MAFLDDVYVVNPRPDSVLHSYTALEEELWTHAGTRINGGKTRVWNRSGSQPRGCDILQRIAVQSDPDAVVWRGSDVPTVQQGIKILGTPLGHHDYVQNQLERVADEHQRFMDMLPSVPNLQSSWLLLVHCASARANYLLRTVCPDSVRGFAEAHDRGLWECVCTLLNIPIHQDQSTRDTATLPLSLGGLGLRSAVRTSPSAFWASWADCLPMISARHPAVADMIIRELDGHPVTPCLSAASRIARDLVGVGGFEPPSWISLANGARPHMRQPEDMNLAGSDKGGSMRQLLELNGCSGMPC